MLDLFKIDSKAAILASSFAILGLSACSNPTASDTPSTITSSTTSSWELTGDHAIGNPDADVTLVEYASVGCGHCATFHETVYPDLKAKYIDTGKVRFIFREFNTGNPTMTRTGFLLANCADQDQYFNNISLQFKRFEAIQKSSDPKSEYIAIAKSAGLSEDEFIECVINRDGLQDLKDRFKVGVDAGVTGTPTFFINGEKVSKTPSGETLFKIESFDEVLGPLLGEETE